MEGGRGATTEGGRGARNIDLNIPAPEREEVQAAPNQWTITKKLSYTDANPDRCEIILPIRQVKEHLLPFLLQDKLDILQSGRPILINVINDDIMKAYRIKLAFKNSSTSYMLQETRALVTEGNFIAGKEIKFRWNRVTQEDEGELHFTLHP